MNIIKLKISDYNIFSVLKDENYFSYFAHSSFQFKTFYFLDSPFIKIYSNKKSYINNIISIIKNSILIKFHRPITVYFFPLYKKPKLLPLKFKILGPEEVNSGYCILSNDPYICIFRYEEMYKVLIHELIHIYRIDKYLY